MEVRSVYIKHIQGNNFIQHYILATTPVETPGTKTCSTAFFLQQLTKIHQYLLTPDRKNEPSAINKNITFDADITGELYGIYKQTAAIAIAMIMGKSLAHHKFKSIAIQSCLAPVKAYNTNAKLKRTIRVLFNTSKSQLHLTKGEDPQT